MTNGSNTSTTYTVGSSNSYLHNITWTDCTATDTTWDSTSPGIYCSDPEGEWIKQSHLAMLAKTNKVGNGSQIGRMLTKQLRDLRKQGKERLKKMLEEYTWEKIDGLVSAALHYNEDELAAYGDPVSRVEALLPYASLGGEISLGIAGNYTFKLPDGAIVSIKLDNNKVEVLDDDAKVIYKANTHREFNRYVNASDLLEEFIDFCGKLGVKQQDFLNIPIELFINWLIIMAANADGEPVPDDVTPVEKHPALPAPNNQPRCRACGRFISDEKVRLGINFCDDQHLLVFMQKRGVR